ncbi:hypothetical protein SLS60_010268 [Paraconiothyrium brasiliense]|uniref:Nephrocystin 3-like N-terminal domain-containing protein n=1 Tax=Paraconiothyrium brasiliense TaxID=300254 RepID=A0ABR3QQZ6_9PLEO
MDPLSIAASVAGLLSLALQLVELGTKCSSRFLKAQLYEFVFELNALSDVLKRLKGFLDDPTTALTFSRISVFVSTNTRCKILLEELLAKLQKTIQEPNKVKKAVDRVLWPFNEKEHRISMQKIHRYTQIFTFALTIEGCSLLSQSVREVTVALQEQEKKLKETKKLCGSIPNLISQIEQSLDQISSIQALVYALPDHSRELSVISDDISLLKSTATRQQQQIDESQRSKVLSWLSPATFEAKQRQLQERHEPGTGAWFLRHDTFIQWKSERGSTLWCAGIPGAGKTFMASLIIETLRQSGYSVAFVFADYKEHMSNTKVNLISSLTRQLASQNQRNMDAAYSRYTKRLEQSSADDADPLTFEEHSEILQDISTNSDRIFVIVDAVDELPNTDEVRGSGGRAELLNALAQLHNVSKLFTTRPHIDAASFFPDFLQLDIAAKDQDLRTFLKARMSAAHRLSRILAKDRYLENQIIQTITSKSSGMFLLAQLQIEEVKTALSVRQVRAVLESLSGHLSDMYEKTIDRIKSQSSIEAKLGLRAISWIANVKRPLAMSEFVHAISLEQDDDHVDSSSLIDIQFIFETCGGLVQLQPASFELGFFHGAFTHEESVGFVHYTIQEYLDSCNLSAVNAVHADIANTSLSYLCLRDFRQRTRVSRSLYPFLAYAAPFWPAHAEAAGDLLRWDLVELLINETRPHLGRNWLDVALHEQLGPSSNIPLGFAGAAVAIHGAHSILRFMLDKGLRVDVRFRTVLNPVKLALSCLPRHEDCIKLLMHSVSAREENLVRDWLANLLEQILYASRYTKHADDQLRSFLSDESSLPSQHTHKVFEAAIVQPNQDKKLFEVLKT